MFRYLISAALAQTMALSAAAITVDATPGALSALIDSPAELTELTVSGSVDARDLFFIADEMPALKSLDLLAVTITAYEGAAVRQLVRYNAGEIPAGAFAGSRLESITLPAGKVTVGEAAFAGSQLKSIIVPAGYVLGMGAFAGCGVLTSAQLGVAEIPDGAFSGCPQLSKVTAADVLTIGRSAFRNCTLLSEFYGSTTLRSIGADAFAGCSKLGAFAFPASLERLGNAAFSATGLVTADLTACSRLTDPGDWTFSECTTLRWVRLPGSLERLGSGIFFDCCALNRVDISAECSAIGSYALKGNSTITEFNVASGVEYIGDYAMAGMTSLKNLYAHEHSSVPELGENVWAGVDQPAVSLHVLEMLYSDFAAADQWRNFALVEVASESDVVLSPRQQVRGRFEDTTLRVDFGGLDARGLALYDVSGMRLAEVDVRGMVDVAVDTSAWTGKVFLVRVALANGKIVSLKLGRN